jgi:hypothetical protein
VGRRPAARAAITHFVWAWRRRRESPSGVISMCSLSAGRCLPQRGQRYVAGLAFWALRIAYHFASNIRGRIALGSGAQLSSLSVEQRDERIVVETNRYRIAGLLHLPKDGYRSRLTDYLNASERAFLPLTDVEISPLDGSATPEFRPFLVISLQHVVLAMPADGTRAETDDSH